MARPLPKLCLKTLQGFAMLQCHRSKRLKVLQGPPMTFENLQVFRRGFAGWETLKRFERPKTELFQRKLPNFLSVFIYFFILANNL